MSGGNGQPSIDNAEHIGTVTGDNVEAKRVQLYGFDAGNSVSRRVAVDSSGNLSSSGGSITQYADGAARGTAAGTLGMVDDGTNIQSRRGDSAGNAFVLLTDASNTLNVLAPSTPTSAQAGQNAIFAAPTGATTTTITLNAGTPNGSWYDLLNYPFITAEVLTNTGTTITWQTSGDVSQTVVSSMGFGLAGNTANSVSNTVASGTTGNYYAGRIGRWFRPSSNASGGNSATVVLTFYTDVPYPATTGVQAGQAGTWTVQPGNTANTTAWLMAGGKTNNNAVPGATNIGALVGIANAAAPTYVEGDQVLVSTDLLGNLRTNAGLMPSGTALVTYSAQISTSTTTTPTSSTAYVSSIVVSITSAGTTSTLTVKDKQGTPLTLVNTFSTAVLSAGDTTFNFQTPVKMTSGIDIVTAGAAAATLSIFINYYQ